MPSSEVHVGHLESPQEEPSWDLRSGGEGRGGVGGMRGCQALPHVPVSPGGGVASEGPSPVAQAAVGQVRVSPLSTIWAGDAYPHPCPHPIPWLPLGCFPGKVE